ncbi:hypothetical protein TUM17384_26680 [Shewanella algae]|nr:hypothetical protein TUM17384_26680 [Shewanella algae]
MTALRRADGVIQFTASEGLTHSLKAALLRLDNMKWALRVGDIRVGGIKS